MIAALNAVSPAVPNAVSDEEITLTIEMKSANFFDVAYGGKPTTSYASVTGRFDSTATPPAWINLGPISRTPKRVMIAKSTVVPEP